MFRDVRAHVRACAGVVHGSDFGNAVGPALVEQKLDHEAGPVAKRVIEGVDQPSLVILGPEVERGQRHPVLRAANGFDEARVELIRPRDGRNPRGLGRQREHAAPRLHQRLVQRAEEGRARAQHSGHERGTSC